MHTVQQSSPPMGFLPIYHVNTTSIAGVSSNDILWSQTLVSMICYNSLALLLDSEMKTCNSIFINYRTYQGDLFRKYP